MLLPIGPGCGKRQAEVERGLDTKTLHAGIGAEPAGIDPHRVTGIPDFRVIQALYEGLVNRGPSDQDSIVPGMATSWSVDDAGLQVTFKLREDAVWSDGRPVTATDFRAAYLRVLDPDVASPHAPLLYPLTGAKAFHAGRIPATEFEGAVAQSPRTLVLSLEQPVGHFLELIKHPAWLPLPAHRIQNLTTTGQILPGSAVTNGPFQLKAWESGSRIIVVKSPTYWNRASVALNAIHFYPIDNTATELRAYRNGQLHLTDDVPYIERARLAEKQPTDFHQYPILATTYLLFNNEKSVLRDARVRRALALAIDRVALADSLAYTSQPAPGFVPGTLPGYGASLENHHIQNLDTARRLLAEAGYPGGAGFPVLEYSTSNSDTSRQVAEAIQQMWKTGLGITVNLFNSEFRVYLDNLNQGRFDIGYLAWYGDFTDPVTFLNILRTGNPSNRARFSNSRYDSLLDHATATRDSPARYRILEHAESLLLKESPISPIFWLQTSRMVHPSVQGWEPRLLDLHPWHYLNLQKEEPGK